MKVRRIDYTKILTHLYSQRIDGFEYVAFPSDFPVEEVDLACFGTIPEAARYCREMSTGDIPYGYRAIRSAYRTMSEGIGHPEFIIEENGWIDVGKMIDGRYERFRRLAELTEVQNKNSEIMNQKNYDYLKDQVKYTGFGEWLDEALKQQLESGKDEFSLRHKTEYGADKVEASLDFSKSKETEMYFFNKYHVEINSGEKKSSQTFYINRGNNITLKEAYNLMKGRAVHKELTDKDGNKYKAWVKLDFKTVDDDGNFKRRQYHENYGFELDQVLARYPIKELETPEYKQNLLDSLSRGNLQSVTFVGEDGEKKMLVSANPQFKSLNVFDANMKRQVSQTKDQQSESQKASQSQEQGKTEGNKQSAGRKSGQKASGTAKARKTPAAKQTASENAAKPKSRAQRTRKGRSVA